MNNASELKKMRARIDAVDRDIISALADRARLSKAIGAHKRANKIPLLDTARRAELLESRAAMGTTKDLPAALVRKIFALIHADSVKVQKRRI